MPDCGINALTITATDGNGAGGLPPPFPVLLQFTALGWAWEHGHRNKAGTRPALPDANIWLPGLHVILSRIAWRGLCHDFCLIGGTRQGLAHDTIRLVSRAFFSVESREPVMAAFEYLRLTTPGYRGFSTALSVQPQPMTDTDRALAAVAVKLPEPVSGGASGLRLTPPSNRPLEPLLPQARGLEWRFRCNLSRIPWRRWFAPF